MSRTAFTEFREAIAVLSFVALGLAGCASERSRLTIDPSLTAGALDEGSVAIAGVTMVDEVEQIRPPLNRALEQVLRASHSDVRFLSPDSVEHRLGHAAARDILFRFQQKGSLDDASRAALDHALAGVTRYVLFARVEKSKVHGPGRPRAGQIRYGTLGSSWTSSREARVRFMLYDLRQRTIAMDATYESSSENALPDDATHREPRRKSPTVGDHPSAPDFEPETPGISVTIVEACRAFAVDLPRAGSSPAPSAPAR